MNKTVMGPVDEKEFLTTFYERVWGITD
jgi:hypothetical protein